MSNDLITRPDRRTARLMHVHMHVHQKEVNVMTDQNHGDKPQMKLPRRDRPNRRPWPWLAVQAILTAGRALALAVDWIKLHL